MSFLELLARSTAVFAALYSLGLTAFVLADLALPRSARSSLRLLATLAGQMALTAIVVQALGLLGLLRAPIFLASCLGAGLAAAVLRRRSRPLRAFWRLLADSARLWLAAPGWGLGPLTLVLLAMLGDAFFALPRDVDALAMHGPLIAEWVQTGRVGFDSRWNYPLCWEYQFVPSFLLLRSDALAIVPGLMAVTGLLLALRELARRVHLGGRAAHWVGLLCVASPVIWRETLKSDPAVGLAQLIGILAIERASRGGRGSFWLLQLSLFLVLGTKASGFFYGALLAFAYLVVWLVQRRRAGVLRPLAPLLAQGLALTFLFQASAAAVQARNLAEHGNPMYPLRWQLGSWVLLDGPGDAAGTAILDAAGDPATWKALLAGGRIACGAEWPFLLLALAACAAYASIAAGRIATGRQPLRRRGATFFGLLAAALVLWVTFFGTPWVLGLKPGVTDYLASGQSLRFAIAPLGLTYLVVAALLQHLLGRRRFLLLLAPACLLLVVFKWHGFGIWTFSWSSLGELLAAWAAAAAVAAGVALPAGRKGAKRAFAATLPALLVLGGAIYARHVETAHRPPWTPAYRDIWHTVWNEIPAGSTIALNDGRALFRYLLYGPRFENRLRIFELGRRALGGGAEALPPEIGYLYFFVGPSKADLEPALARLETLGWRVAGVAGDGRGALLRRDPLGADAP